MSDDFDVELRDRLAGLVAAVPVKTAGATMVAAPRIQRGRTSRRLALGGAGSVLGLVVVVSVLAGLGRLGPFAPGATRTSGASAATAASSVAAATTEASNDLAGPSDTAADGGFELTLQADRPRYRAEQPITAVATLTYVGPKAEEIAVGPGGGVVVFSLQEVGGDRHADGAFTLDCSPHSFRPNEPLMVPWQKSGGFGSTDPNAAFVRDYLAGPDFLLPAGTWTLRAGGAFVLSRCGGADVTLFAEITIVVGP